jgi:hypothetical protein
MPQSTETDSPCKKTLGLVKSLSAMKKYLNFLPLLFATGLLAQDELPDLRVQNPGGTVQELFEVKLLRVEPDGLRVLHSAGAAKVPYELLPETLQVKYGFNADHAQEHRNANAAVVAAASNRQAARPAAPNSGVPQPVTADGSSTWLAAPSSNRTSSSTWTDTAGWLANTTPTMNNSISSSYTHGLSSYQGSSLGYGGFSRDYSSRSLGRVGRYGTPVVARVNSRGSSRSSVRYYGASSNCSPYRSPTYVVAQPTVVSCPQYRSTTYVAARSTGIPCRTTRSASYQNSCSGYRRR